MASLPPACRAGSATKTGYSPTYAEPALTVSTVRSTLCNGYELGHSGPRHCPLRPRPALAFRRASSTTLSGPGASLGLRSRPGGTMPIMSANAEDLDRRLRELAADLLA